MATVCSECESKNVHSFQLRSEYGTFHALNGNPSLGDKKPYYVEGTYCENCDEATVTKTINES